MEVNNRDKSWVVEFGCWLSQGLNLVLCVKGATADETVSSRVGKYKLKNNGEVPFPLSWPELFFWVTYHVLSRIPYLKGHFIRAIESDEGK
jgi:hypothetical protein